MSRNGQSTRAEPLLDAIKTNVVLLLVLSAFVLIAPITLLRGVGVENPPFAVLGLVRVYAVLGCVLATLLWQSRRWLCSADGARSVQALVVAHAAGAAFVFLQQLSVWNGRTGVGLFWGCAALAIMYARALRASNRVAVTVSA